MENSDLTAHQDTRPSGDQVEYMYLDLPEDRPLQVPYKTAEYSGKESLDDGYEIHHVYLNCAEIREVGFPLDANPREPASTRQVKAMRRTLGEEAKDFVKKNNGVVVICSDIENEDNKVNFEFAAGEGICNGGHTYFAIQTADRVPQSAQLHLEVLVIPNDVQKGRKDIITDIAKARNNSNELEDRSEADFMGYYEPFQEELIHPELVRWRENDSDANAEANPIDAVQFLRLIKSLDVATYEHPVYNKDANTHKSLATSRTRFHSSWVEKVEKALDNPNADRPLQYLTPLANDVMYIRDLLSYTFPQRDQNQVSLGSFRQTNLWDDYIINNDTRPLLMDEFEPSVGVDLQNTLEVLFIGLFRSNLFCSPNPNESSPKYVGWLKEPANLWYEQATAVLDPMADLFSDLGDDPKQFIRISSPFNNSLYQFGMDKEIRRPPAVIYDINSGDRYEKVNDRADAEYCLSSDQRNMRDVQLQPLTDDISKDAAVYRASSRWDQN